MTRAIVDVFWGGLFFIGWVGIFVLGVGWLLEIGNRSGWDAVGKMVGAILALSGWSLMTYTAGTWIRKADERDKGRRSA